VSIFGHLLTSKSDEQQFVVQKMPLSYTNCSPYCKIADFNAKTKVVCQKTDLSLFLDQCKVIFIGDCEAGKTSLINRFASSSFDHCYRATLDVDFQTKYFEILNIAYTIGIWDLSGEEKYKILNQPYYKNANGKRPRMHK
jgi:hypothetical protein